MSVWERIHGDDLAYLALIWLLVCAVAIGLYVWAVRRWERYTQDMRIDRAPDSKVYRAGSAEDFKGRMARSRFP